MSETCMTHSETRKRVTSFRLEFLAEDDQGMGTYFITRSLFVVVFFNKLNFTSVQQHKWAICLMDK